MKVSRVQRPRSKAQSDGRAARVFSHFGRWALNIGRQPSRLGDRDGIALVITLIMLSIITFLAVTFLVLSQRERSSVTTAMDQKMARDATDDAFSRVSAELLTRMMLHTNFQDFDLLVSTNYYNAAGFVQNISSPTNVNYDYIFNSSNPLNAQDRQFNIANLLYDPRPPVYVDVNSNGTTISDFRYYLDLNRNGRPDRNGNWPVAVATNGGVYFVATNGSTYSATLPPPNNVYLLTNYFVGDPEWIGVLARPWEPHSADNPFVARYAFLVVPAGKTLDVNTMHNQAAQWAQTKAFVIGNDGYLRNQGVGPWELNLAAFFVDLNTNIWDADPNSPNLYYRYNRGDVNSAQYPNANLGLSFQDAFSILSYRYKNNYASLFPANVTFRTPGALTVDNIDEYSDGPLMLGLTNVLEAPADAVSEPWAGSENTNHYFSQQDFFNRGLVGAGFAGRLQQAGTNIDSYNAYTFYRLLSQLGTDSTPDETRLNVNFKNTDDHGQVVSGMETNMNGWTSALDFFTNAAAAMFQQMNLRDFRGNLVTVTNIPFYEDPVVTGITNQNYYTPAVHRVLQLAANIVDATITNRFVGSGPTNFPSVFRPIFSVHNGVAYVSGYTEVNDSADAFRPMLDPSNVVKTEQSDNAVANVYGLPWVIGAKKGFPNFNEFSMENPLTVSRKLTFTNSNGMRPWTTNQVFDFAITNSFGLEAWNSYTNFYGRSLRLVASNELSITVTNETGTVFIQATNIPYGVDQIYSSWPGWTQQLTDNSFKVPLYAASVFTNGIYDKVAPFFHQVAPPFWTSTFVPHVWMTVQFKLRFVLIDPVANRVVDFVNIASTQPPVDLAAMLNNNNPITSHWSPDYTTQDGQWNTNLLSGTTVSMGVLNQIEVSKADRANIWTDPQRTIQGPIFNRRLLNGGTNYFEAPYTPHRVIVQRISFQANDPLVHFTASDLINTNAAMINYNLLAVGPVSSAPLANLTNLNIAYQPWGGRHLPNNSSQTPNPFDVDFRVKDPLVQQSDDWNFPTNKLPNIGWLGRIHRGTPWQTVYMKPSSLTPDQWRNWSGDNVVLTNGNRGIPDAPHTSPTDDYRLFDLFTAALNPNAARGQLDVNQTNLAAWSAVFTGVNVISNANGGMMPMVISPAGVYNSTNPSPLAAIVEGINATRSGTNRFNSTVFGNKTFQHAGDVLATPQLTVASPFLNTKGLGDASKLPFVAAAGITDEMMERIPQQIMSLLTLNQSPRFVIYSFGQTLHPAAGNPLVAGGQFNGLCTNYQITAESATRAVVRVEGSPDPQYSKDGPNPHPDPQGRYYPPHLVVEQFNVLGPD